MEWKEGHVADGVSIDRNCLLAVGIVYLLATACSNSLAIAA
jgi:hypothetical protein